MGDDCSGVHSCETWNRYYSPTRSIPGSYILCECIFQSREETFAFASFESGVELKRGVESVSDCLLDRVLAHTGGEAFTVTFCSLPPLLWRIVPLGNTCRCCRTQQPLWSNSIFDVSIESLLWSWKDVIRLRCFCSSSRRVLALRLGRFLTIN